LLKPKEGRGGGERPPRGRHRMAPAPQQPSAHCSRGGAAFEPFCDRVGRLRGTRLSSDDLRWLGRRAMLLLLPPPPLHPHRPPCSSLQGSIVCRLSSAGLSTIDAIDARTMPSKCECKHAARQRAARSDAPRKPLYTLANSTGCTVGRAAALGAISQPERADQTAPEAPARRRHAAQPSKAPSRSCANISQDQPR